MIRNTMRRAWILVIFSAVVLTGGIDQTTKDALKVKHILRTIERQPPRTGGDERTAQVTQKELNAYITHRLAREKRPLVKRLKINLLDNNHVQGSISFDADHLNVSGILGQALDFDFKGILVSRNRAARLELISLYLDGYPMKPQVLDFVLGTAASYYNTDVGRLDDWYALPKGIERIMVTRAKATLYY